MTNGSDGTVAHPPRGIRRLIARGKAIWSSISARPGVAHLIRAGERSSDRLSGQFAAAITYFSFLSLVPILMVGFSIAGFVLSSQPDLLVSLKGEVTSLLPSEDLASSVGKLIDTAVSQSLAVGIVGLLVAAYSGLNWMGNIREAVRAQWRPQWERTKAARGNVLRSYLWDLLSLVGLGIALVVSFSLTAVGTAAQHLVIGWLGLQDVGWLTPVLTVGPLLVAIAADMLIFVWVYTILPYKAYRASRRNLLIGSLAMSVSFEVLKAALTFLVTRMSSSPTGAIFGSIIGLLFFFNLVARIFLLVAAWIATGTPQADGLPSPDETTANDVAPDGGAARGELGNVGVVGYPPATVVTLDAEPDRRRTAAVFGIGLLAGALWRRWRGRR